MGETVSKNKESKLLKWRQRFGYGMLESGRFLADFLINLYLMIYLTDEVKLPLAAVGSMFLVCKLIDAVTDYVAGILVDRTYTRFGRSRPWSALGTVMVFVGLILVFHIPGSFSVMGQLVFIYCAYEFYSLGLTFLNIPEFTILPALTNSPEERTVLATCRQLFGNVINFFGTSVCAAMLVYFSTGGGSGYPQVANVVAVVVVVFEVIGIGLVREIYVDKKPEAKKEDKKDGKKKSEGNPLVETLHVFKNKRFWLFGFMAAFISFSFMMTLTCGAYFFRYVMEDVQLQGTCMMSLSLAQFLGMFLCPAANKRFSKRLMIMGGIIMAEVGYVMLFFGTASSMMVIAAYFLVGLGFAFSFTMYFSMMPELFDYLECELGYSVSGITSSLTQYLVKVGNALCSTVVAAVLVVGQYDPNLEVQKSVTKLAETVNISVIPGVIALAGLICVFFLDVEKKYPEVSAELARRRQAKESREAAATIS